MLRVVKRGEPVRNALRLLALIFAVLVLLVVALLYWLLGGVIADPVPGFDARKGELVSVRQTSSTEMQDSTLTELTLLSSSGLEVELALRKPHTPMPGRPLLVVMGGQETGRAAAELIPAIHGVTVAALSYPFAVIPHRDGLAMALSLRPIQRGILDTPPSVLLVLDYLLSKPGLGERQVELAGISFGAFLAPVPGALDSRFERVWLIHGAGEPAQVIEGGLEGRVSPRWLRRMVARLLAATAGAHHLGPEQWVGNIAPRPVVAVSARDDRAVPEQAVSALHRALGEPSQVFWTRGQHVHPKRPEVVREIVDLMFSEIVSGEEVGFQNGSD